MDTSSLIDTLVNLLKGWTSSNKARLRDLLETSRRKYEDLEQAHILFSSGLREIEDSIQRIWIDKQDHIGDEGLTDLENVLNEIDDRRAEYAHKRRAGYAEAEAYLEHQFSKQLLILKAVPRIVEEALRVFMTSYVRYFQTGDMYSHELSNVLEWARRDIDYIRRESDPDKKKNKIEVLFRSYRHVSFARSYIDYKWMELSRNYFRLYAVLGDHGVHGIDDGPL